MPTVRRRKRYCRPVGRKKRYAGRRRRTVRTYRRRLRIPRSRITTRPFPKTKVVKLKYCTHFKLTPTSELPTGGVQAGDGSITITPGCNRTFRAGDIYDPDFLVGGHQPYGSDQLAAIYDKYTVLGSKIVCKFVNDRTDQTMNEILAQPVYVGIMRHTHSTDRNRLNTAAQINLALESPPTRDFAYKMRLLKSQNSPNGMATTVVMNYNPKYQFHIAKKDSIMQESGLSQIEFGHSPTKQAYYTIIAKDVPQASSAWNGVTVQMTIEYTVLCTDPKYLAQS